MEKLFFEHKHKITEEEYIQIWSIFKPNLKKKLISRVLFLVVGVGCLFWKYTVGVGILLLLLFLLSVFMPRTIPGTVRRTFKENELNSKEFTYGLNDDSLWIKTSGFSVELKWEFITVWRVRGNWLVLSANQSPPIYLPISELKERSIYESVMSKVSKYAERYKD